MFTGLIKKLLFIIAIVRYPKIPKHLVYFIRDNYYARLRQIKYFRKDYLVKKPYKTVRFSGEFEPELLYVLPFAYWHFLNGTLKQTISARNTEPLYFFSPDHQAVFDARVWEDNEGDFEIPNFHHSADFSYTKWAPVPMKAQYANGLFVFSKPILVVANKYNVEWAEPPINFLSIEMLKTVFDRYRGSYQIIYNRPPAKQIVGDNSEILDLGEHTWIRSNYPEVIFMEDLYEEYKDRVTSFNHLQVMVYANSNHFISVHGGTGTLASYFGGTNVIFSKRGIEHAFREFERIFPKLSGARIVHVKHENDFEKALEAIPVQG